MNLEERLYTSTEVAKVLGVSLRSVYRYLDQGKLDAEIKTATGRLRFTKKDILNFLYPDGDVDSDLVNAHFSKELLVSKKHSPLAPSEETSEMSEESTPVSVEISHKTIEEIDIVSPVYEEPLADEIHDANIPTQTVSNSDSLEEEEIDWLAKFRAAAKAYSMEKETESSTKDVAPVNPASSSTPISPQVPTSPVFETVNSVKTESTGISSRQVNSLNSETEDTSPSIQHSYYKSMLGGLKEIAQNIDKVARKSSVDYAFTLYAGLSLEKPLKKPFSLLHVYVDSSTESLFQRMLQLEPTDESNAQLCLMIPNGSKVFANKVEKHGLYVVDSAQLREDFSIMGLFEEVEALL